MTATDRLGAPNGLLGPGSWPGAGTLVGCAGAIVDGRGDLDARRLQVSLSPWQRRSCTRSLEDTWDEEDA